MTETIGHRIEIDPLRCHGKPVIAGTRVLVRSVLAGLAAGETHQRLADSYGITEEDIRAAIGFANRLMGEWDQFPVRS